MEKNIFNETACNFYRNIFKLTQDFNLRTTADIDNFFETAGPEKWGPYTDENGEAIFNNLYVGLYIEGLIDKNEVQKLLDKMWPLIDNMNEAREHLFDVKK